jgi:hypothetical protein
MRNLLFSFSLLAFLGAPAQLLAVSITSAPIGFSTSFHLAGTSTEHSNDFRPKKKKTKKKKGKKNGCEAYSSFH